MNILIQTSNQNYCNCCNSFDKKEYYNISLGSGNPSLHLCKECLNEFKETINKEIKNG